MTLPLAGIRVVDLTNVVAGPLCSYQLGLLGADVIKVEAPGTGDLSRKMGADADLAAARMGASFCATNGGKRSITLNLKHPQGRAIFLRLAGDADVVLENFRPGVTRRLGVDYPAVREVNPSVVYCSVSGFGQEGPLAERPSYDQIIQGYAGLMSVTGDRDTAPMRAGYLVCDAIGAMTAAFAICAALVRRERTGEGEAIDVAMVDATLSTMACWIVSNYLNAGHVPVPMGNENHSAAPSGTYRTADAPINIVTNEQHQFEKLCEVIGRPALATDPRFAERSARVRNRVALKALLEDVLAGRGAREWENLFAAAGVPVGPVLGVPEVLDHPQLAARGLVQSLGEVAAVGRELRVTRAGFRLAGEQPAAGGAPPMLGEHTDALLGELGYDAEAIARLRREGAV